MTPVLPLVLAVVVFVLAPIAHAYASRVRREGHALPGAAEEVPRLREEVERLGAEVARLTEEQAFMLRLLAPGGGPSAAPSPQGGGEQRGGEQAANQARTGPA